MQRAPHNARGDYRRGPIEGCPSDQPPAGSITLRPAKYRRKNPRSRLSRTSACRRACAPMRKSAMTLFSGSRFPFRLSCHNLPAVAAASAEMASNCTPRTCSDWLKASSVGKWARTSAHTMSQATSAPVSKAALKAFEDVSPNSGSAAKTSSRTEVSRAVLTTALVWALAFHLIDHPRTCAA